MKRFAFTFVLFSGIIFLLAQCGSADAGAKTADQFFKSVIKGDFEKAASMVQRPTVGDTTDIIAQLQVMQNNPVNGQLKSFKKSFGFKSNISNGVTTVELPYTLIYDQGKQNFTVYLEDRGNGNKIVSVR